MQKKLIKCALFGGIIVYVWSVISWVVLPWHFDTMHRFTNESHIMSDLREGASVNGMYLLPHPSASETKDSHMEKVAKGPTMLAVVHPHGKKCNMPSQMILGIITQIAAALCIGWMLLQTKGLKFRARVGFVTLAGVFAALVCEVPNWNWWGYSGAFIMIGILDLVIGWFLAGLAMARLTK